MAEMFENRIPLENPLDECTAPSNTEEISKPYEMLAAVQLTNSDLEKSVASPCPESGPSHAHEALVAAALAATLDAVVHSALDEALGVALDRQHPNGQGVCKALDSEEHTTEALLAMLARERRHREGLLRQVHDNEETIERLRAQQAALVSDLAELKEQVSKKRRLAA